MVISQHRGGTFAKIPGEKLLEYGFGVLIRVPPDSRVGIKIPRIVRQTGEGGLAKSIQRPDLSEVFCPVNDGCDQRNWHSRVLLPVVSVQERIIVSCQARTFRMPGVP